MINWIRWTFFRDRYLWVWFRFGEKNYRTRILYDGDSHEFVRFMGTNYYLHTYRERFKPINFGSHQVKAFNETTLRAVKND